MVFSVCCCVVKTYCHHHLQVTLNCETLQVPSSGPSNGGTHRRTSSWQQQQAALSHVSDMAPERSRGSESTLGGYVTAHSDAGSGLSEVGHSVATPLSSVQQHLRNFSAQSLSGFSDPGTPLAAAPGASDYLVNDSSAQRGPHGVFREGQESPSHVAGMAGSGDLNWGRLGDRPAGRQDSDPSMLFCNLFGDCIHFAAML